MLDVLSGKASRDYACGIKIDEEFETAVYELRAYFGFFKLARTCGIYGLLPRYSSPLGHSLQKVSGTAWPGLC